MNVQTYLFFDGDCQAAIDLYSTALDAKLLHITRFSDAPESLRSPKNDNLIFHSTIAICETLLNLSDDPSQEKEKFGGFALLVHFDSVEALEHAFTELSQNGCIELALQQTFWATRYGIVTDRFGITWKLQFSE